MFRWCTGEQCSTDARSERSEEKHCVSEGIGEGRLGNKEQEAGDGGECGPGARGEVAGSGSAEGVLGDGGDDGNESE